MKCKKYVEHCNISGTLKGNLREPHKLIGLIEEPWGYLSVTTVEPQGNLRRILREPLRDFGGMIEES